MTDDARLASRDLTLDLARVVCVLLVVLVHLLFAGVVRDASGGFSLERTAELQPWFVPVSWLLEIMPLFFVVGGFASAAGRASASRRGEGDEQFVRSRLARLARPALPVFIFFAVVLAVAGTLGLAPALLAGVAIGVGSPLWFLAAYMTVQALAPTMLRLHARRPRTTLAVLFVAICVVDAARLGLDEVLVGLPNCALVWLFAQQLGFFMHDGWFARRAWWQHVAIIVVGYGVLLVLVPWAGYPLNMLSNQYPPTLPIAVLALVEASALTLAKRPLTALMRTRVARGVVFLAGTRLMTIYLWHLPVIMLLIGVQLLLPIPMSTPGSPAWWLERIPWYLGVLAVVWLLSLWLVRYERMPEHVRQPVLPGWWVTAVAVVLFIAPPFAIMIVGLDLPLAIAGAICTTAALWLTRGARARLLAV